jgi:uncharacterized protein (TIGR02246 family)
MKLELKEIRKQREEWLDAVNNNDISRVADLLTEDAVWIPPNMPALKGKTAISDWMNPFFEAYNYEFDIEKLDVRGAGDWAVEHASFRSKLSPKEGGEGSEHQGKYIIIWRWEKDNKWRIERYLDTSDSVDI